MAESSILLQHVSSSRWKDCVSAHCLAVIRQIDCGEPNDRTCRRSLVLAHWVAAENQIVGSLLVLSRRKNRPMFAIAIDASLACDTVV